LRRAVFRFIVVRFVVFRFAVFRFAVARFVVVRFVVVRVVVFRFVVGQCGGAMGAIGSGLNSCRWVRWSHTSIPEAILSMIIMARWESRKGIGKELLSFPLGELRRLSDLVPAQARIPKRLAQ
jgi:hypothetical protein